MHASIMILISLVLFILLLLCCSRSVGCCEQCRSQCAVWSHWLAHHRGLQAHAICQSVWGYRRNAERPPAHQDVQRPSGERRQRVRATQPVWWTLLRVQVRSGGLQWQSAVSQGVTFSCCSYTVVRTCHLDLQLPSLRSSLNMAPFGVKVACLEPGFFKTNVTDVAIMKEALQNLWDRLPQETKDDYGDHFLKTCELLHFC